MGTALRQGGLGSEDTPNRGSRCTLTPEATPSTPRLHGSPSRRWIHVTRQKATSVLRGTRLLGTPLPAGGSWRPQGTSQQRFPPTPQESLQSEGQSWALVFGGCHWSPPTAGLDVCSGWFRLVLSSVPRHSQGKSGPASRARRSEGEEREIASQLLVQTRKGWGRMWARAWGREGGGEAGGPGCGLGKNIKHLGLSPRAGAPRAR